MGFGTSYDQSHEAQQIDKIDWSIVFENEKCLMKRLGNCLRKKIEDDRRMFDTSNCLKRKFEFDAGC